jgi:hypothetical protein
MILIHLMLHSIHSCQKAQAYLKGHRWATTSCSSCSSCSRSSNHSRVIIDRITHHLMVNTVQYICIQNDFLHGLVFLNPKVTLMESAEPFASSHDTDGNVTVDVLFIYCIGRQGGNKKTGREALPPPSTIYTPLFKRKEGRNFRRVLGTKTSATHPRCRSTALK